MPEGTGWVQTVHLPQPSLEDNTADVERLLSILRQRLHSDHILVDLALMRELPDQIRKWNDHVRCVLFQDRNGWTLVSAEDGGNPASPIGMAVDLGTTRVVMRLLALDSGAVLGEDSFDNPQIAVGPDILARIHSAAQPGGLENLSALIVDALNRNAASLCRSVDRRPEDLHLIAVAGNTAMTHLFLQLNPYWMIREPYIPAVNSPGTVKAAEAGLVANKTARLFVFPNVGSYFGGDLIAGILFAGIHRKEEPAMLVDVGTNAEVLLGNKDWLMACAGAAGPALEGGVTKMGMMAGPGVIDRITIDADTHAVSVHTIGEKPPRGICGSGLIDLAAQLFLSGLMDVRGRMVPSSKTDRVRELDGVAHFVVVPAEEAANGQDLTISQIDLDSLTRSKAAMYTILETITMAVGMEFKELSRFYIAGTFGSFINPQSAIAIGMVPDLPLSTYEALGNSSLGGATKLLQSSEAMAEIMEIRDTITYMELNVNQDFMNRFSAAKFFPHTDRGRFPSVAVSGEKP